MAMSEPAQDDIFPLWPTWVGQLQLPGAEEPNRALADLAARAAHVVRPSAGTLLMWPSPLQHYVHPNLSQEHRISISYNLIMDRYTGSK